MSSRPVLRAAYGAPELRMPLARHDAVTVFVERFDRETRAFGAKAADGEVDLAPLQRIESDIVPCRMEEEGRLGRRLGHGLHQRRADQSCKEIRRNRHESALAGLR